MGDEGRDQIPGGAGEGLRAAEVSRISLHECRIEIVLTNQKAQLIAEPWLAIA